MLKNALFLLKNCKNRSALGDFPPDPLASTPKEFQISSVSEVTDSET